MHYYIRMYLRKTRHWRLKKLKHYYNEKNFPRDSDYEIRMDRLITVIRAHETEEEMELWRVWMKYFVTMGGSEWKEFWSDSGCSC